MTLHQIEAARQTPEDRIRIRLQTDRNQHAQERLERYGDLQFDECPECNGNRFFAYQGENWSREIHISTDINNGNSWGDPDFIDDQDRDFEWGCVDCGYYLSLDTEAERELIRWLNREVEYV